MFYEYAKKGSFMSSLLPVVDQISVCKCCGGNSKLFDVVDFNKTGIPYELSGMPVYYYRCQSCGFIYTNFFDNFTDYDFATRVYNDEYILVDPDYVEARPKRNAESINALLSKYKDYDILDYGGGNGKLMQFLMEDGFKSVETYDPFSTNYNIKPDKKYDCILCFEVVEHSPTPIETFVNIMSFLKDTGILVFSTVLQPEEVDKQKCNWWYAVPRNGHMSLYSTESLNSIAKKLNCHFETLHYDLHLMHRTVPS